MRTDAAAPLTAAAWEKLQKRNIHSSPNAAFRSLLNLTFSGAFLAKILLCQDVSLVLPILTLGLRANCFGRLFSQRQWTRGRTSGVLDSRGCTQKLFRRRWRWRRYNLRYRFSGEGDYCS